MRWLKILAVQAVIAVLLLEALLRIYNPMPFRVRGDEIVLPVGVRYTRHNNPGTKLDPVTIHTRNRLGFRGADMPGDFASRLSIVTVGGSTTECFLLSDGRTWTDVMGAALSRTHPDVWVNNAGFDGHSTFGHLILLRQVLVKLQPKVVVFLAGINDEGMDWGHPSGDFELHDSRRERLARALSSYSEVGNALVNLARAWQARHFIFGDQPVEVASFPRKTMTEAEVDALVASHAKYLGGYEARLARLASESRAAHIEPVFLTQPELVGDAIDPATGTDLSTLADHADRNGHADWRLLETYNDAMRRVAKRDHVFLIDLAHLLPKDSRYFYDFIHFSNDGAHAVGEIVAAELGPHLSR